MLFFSDMYVAYFLAGQATASPSAPYSSQTLQELIFSLFLSSNFKTNEQFGFGQRSDTLQSLNLTVSYPLYFVLESFFYGCPSHHLLRKSVRLDPFMEYTFIPSISSVSRLLFGVQYFPKFFPHRLYVLVNPSS